MTILGEDGNPLDSSAVSEAEEQEPTAVDQADGAVQEPAAETEQEPGHEPAEDTKKPGDEKPVPPHVMVVLDEKGFVNVFPVGIPNNDLRTIRGMLTEAADMLLMQMSIRSFRSLMTAVRPATAEETRKLQQAQTRQFLRGKRR